MSRSRYPLTPAAAAPGRAARTRARAPTAGKPAVPYVARTLLQLPDTMTRQTSYVVAAGDRIDNVAAKLLGDPLLYYLLMEANDASDPALLCAVPGRMLIVPAAAGHNISAFGQPASPGRSSAAPAADHQADGDAA